VFLTTTVFSQKTTSNVDTLYIQYEKALLKKERIKGKNNYRYKIKGTGQKEDFTYLLKEFTLLNLQPKKTYKLSEILNDSGALKNTTDLSDWKLFSFFNDKVIFLKENNTYVKVLAVYETE
jgi:hypothetical protein